MANVENKDKRRRETGSPNVAAPGPSMRTRAALKRAAVNVSSLQNDSESRKPHNKVLKCETSRSEAPVVERSSVMTQCPDPMLLATVHTDQFARCAVEFNNKLFVLCGYLSENVFTYRTTDGSNYERLRVQDIVISDPAYLMDIVVCSDTKQLYISGRLRGKRDSGHVWRVPLLEGDKDQNQEATKWLPNNVDRDALVNGLYPDDEFVPVTLSIRGGRLLVVITDAILIYTPDGVEARRIEPDINVVKDLRRAVETDHETVIAAHSPAQISEISYDGSIIRQFADAKITISGFLPNVLLCPSGRLLVAEQHGVARIIALNGRLELERVLLEKNQTGFCGPAIGFRHVHETGHLITCGYYASVVQVWAVNT